MEDWAKHKKKILSEDSRSPGRDLNPRPPEYEAGMPTTINFLGNFSVGVLT
jgi:hypothetical protein